MESLNRLQCDFLYTLQVFRESEPSWINQVLVFLSEGGILLLPLLCAVIFWSVDKKKGLYIMHAFSFAFLLNGILKLAFCVYRPWVLDPRLVVAEAAVEEATGYSFPSAHSTMAAAILGGIAVAWPKKRSLTVIAIAVTAAIMFARMYLGCHTPVDVLVGAGLGVLFILVFRPVLKKDISDTSGDWKWVVLLLACCAATVLFVQLKSYPMDYVNGELLVDPELMKQDTFAAVGIMAGIAVGNFLERKYIHFEMPTSIGKAILRSLIGGVCFALLYAVIVKKLVAGLNPNIGKTIRYFVAIIFTTAVYPWIIKLCKGKL